MKKEGEEEGGIKRTLIKPPSGFARRNAGCALTFGRRSCAVRIFLNSGTGPLFMMGAGCMETRRRGDVGSFDQLSFLFGLTRPADWAYESRAAGKGAMGGSCADDWRLLW